MALKDWTKTGINTWKNGIKQLSISKNAFFEIWYAYVKSPMSGYYFEDKKFKTKSAALKFARAYMRTH